MFGMSEVQNHGFVFEDRIKDILGVDKSDSKYTQKWDIPGKKPISIKFMGLKYVLEFGSTVRIWEINQDFKVVVGRWQQEGKKKIIKSIDEFNITPKILEKMKGSITFRQMKSV